MNTLARKAFGNLEGERCHKIFRDSETPCKDCLLLESKTRMEGDSETFMIRGLQDQAIEVIHQRLVSDPDRWILIGKSADLFPISDVNCKEIANALDVMGDGVSIVDLNGKIVYANKAHGQMLGYSLRELVGADISIFFPPDLKEETANKILGETKRGSWGGILVNARKDGGKFWASLKTAPIHDGNGAVAGNLWIVRDVSEMEENKMLDESVQRVRQLESILDLTTSVMSVDSQEEAVKKVLSAMTSVLGFNKGLILKMSENSGELECSHSTGFLPREMMRLERVKLPMSDLMSVIDGPWKLVGERTILLNERTSPGHPADDEKLSATRRVMSNLFLEHPGDRFIITIEDNKGELIGVIMLAEATDETLGGSKGTIDLLEIYGNLASIAINNARLFEMEIAARGEVETLNDLMTHDINNFIQGVLGYLDMIGNDESASEMHRKYAHRAIEQVEGTKRLIENVRKLAWIKTGFPEKISPYDLGKVIGESLTHVMDTYPNKNVNFISTIDTGQFFVMGGEMIQELFINLISNSVKFTPSQDVPIELGVKTQVEIGKEFWRVEVVDHGRGIPEDRKQFVFERFGKQKDYTPYGFGLGLSICRNLTRKYGGRIWVENRVPEDYRKGSKFVILLPKFMPEAPEEEPAAGIGGQKKRVVRKMKRGSSTGTSFSRVLKQPRPAQSAGGKASADET